MSQLKHPVFRSEYTANTKHIAEKRRQRTTNQIIQTSVPKPRQKLRSRGRRWVRIRGRIRRRRPSKRLTKQLDHFPNNARQFLINGAPPTQPHRVTRGQQIIDTDLALALPPSHVDVRGLSKALQSSVYGRRGVEVSRCDGFSGCAGGERGEAGMRVADQAVIIIC